MCLCIKSLECVVGTRYRFTTFTHTFNVIAYSLILHRIQSQMYLVNGRVSYKAAIAHIKIVLIHGSHPKVKLIDADLNGIRKNIVEKNRQFVK